MKFNSGALDAHVLAGVGQKKVLVWHYLEDGEARSGSVAAAAYRGPISKALKKAYPDRTTFNILEDNDPSCFQSRKGQEAKAEWNQGVQHTKKEPMLQCVRICTLGRGESSHAPTGGVLAGEERDQGRILVKVAAYGTLLANRRRAEHGP